jgi:antitoxin ParD1/3/4
MANVDLDPHLEAFVRRQIDAGRYHDVGEVIRDGLRLLEEREAAIGEIRGQLEEALDDPSPDLPAEDVFARLEELSRLKQNNAP